MKRIDFRNTMFLALIASATSFSACTKMLDYKEVYKEQVETKSVIDTDAEYVYVASSDLSNHDSLEASGARPYWQGSESIVKFRFTEKFLEAYATEEEGRLTGNMTNERLVMQIPVEHIEYRCAKDRQGKCKNEEEKNEESNWSERSRFKPAFQDAKVIEKSLLPVEMDKVFGDSCYSEASSKLLNYEMTADAINIQYLKVFNADMGCLSEKGISVSSLKSTQTQIIYHYSFAKLKSLATQGYKAIDYPRVDESKFGFFTTENRKYDVDFNRMESLKKEFMNRWSPERKEITYYLSDNFKKPEFAAMKAATEKSFEKLNQGLAAAKVNFRLVLKDAEKKSPGDIRNSMIVLVEDPIASGPLGYGPTVANPRTGEILSGRVVMYYGNFLQNIRYTYDEVLRELKSQKREVSTGNVIQPVSVTRTLIKDNLFSSKESSLDFVNALARGMSNILKIESSSNSGSGVSFADSSAITQNKSLLRTKRKDFARAELVSGKRTGDDVLSAMSKYCNYPAELFPFDEALVNGLQGKLGQNLKPWIELSDSEKQQVIDLVMPEIWVPTLVHELGHNLGFRHNFGGSEDKDNFYTKDELANMGVKHVVPYSSVMDYGNSELNLLPTLGKYDIAALRFAYNRQIEDKDGKLLQIKTTVKDLIASVGGNANVLKDYQYCSDEHVEVNPNCKRFDKGTNSLEIVQYLIKSYEEMYERRNFRNGNENFSRMSDGRYFAARQANFAYIRAFMERYESIKHRFNLKDDAKEWSEVDFLKEIKAAALESGRFFLRVLKTPDVLCAIAKKDNPADVIAVERLEAFTKTGLSCFKDVQLRPEYIVVGQAGKMFNSKKDPESDNAYADQIDVRGIFPDKIAAARALFSRKIGNSAYDKYEDNYLDMADLKEEISQTFLAMLLNKVSGELNFKSNDGSEFSMPDVDYSVFSAPEDHASSASNHWIEAALSPEIAKQMGLPMYEVSFQQILINIANNTISSGPSHIMDREFVNAIGVLKTPRTTAVVPDVNGSMIDIGAYRFYSTGDTVITKAIINVVDITNVTDLVDRNELIKYFNQRLKKQQAPEAGSAPPAIAAPAEVELKISAEILAKIDKISLADLRSYLVGQMPKGSEMKYLLNLLPSL